MIEPAVNALKMADYVMLFKLMHACTVFEICESDFFSQSGSQAVANIKVSVAL